MKNLDLNYLKYFYWVMLSGGFTKAAEKLHVQQPVISRAVKLLETQLGFKLLERQKKQIILTSKGKDIFKMAQNIFTNADLITQYAKENSSSHQGDLAFATSDSLAPEIMGAAVGHLLQTHPKIRPVHFSGSYMQAIPQIKSGAIEFGLFFNVLELSDDLEKSKLATVPFEFVISKAYAKDERVLNSFIATKEIDGDQAKRLPLFPKYQLTRKNVDTIAVSSSSIARKAMVLSGLGVTILPRFLVKNEIKNGLLKTLVNENHLLPLYLIERKSSYRSQVKNELLRHIKSAVEV